MSKPDADRLYIGRLHTQHIMIHQSGIHIKNGEIITIQRSVSPRVHTLFEVSFSSIRIIYPYYCSPNTVSRFEGMVYVIGNTIYSFTQQAFGARKATTPSVYSPFSGERDTTAVLFPK